MILICHCGVQDMSFIFTAPGGKHTSCSFIKGSDSNSVNLIFTLHPPEKNLLFLGDIRPYKIFMELLTLRIAKV